jgi:hypothetical protein
VKSSIDEQTFKDLLDAIPDPNAKLALGEMRDIVLGLEKRLADAEAFIEEISSTTVI